MYSNFLLCTSQENRFIIAENCFQFSFARKLLVTGLKLKLYASTKNSPEVEGMGKAKESLRVAPKIKLSFRDLNMPNCSKIILFLVCANKY